MRLALAHFELESVTFLPDATDVADFEHSARRGDAMLSGLRGTNTVVGGFLAACEREGVETVPLFSTSAGAAAAATDAAWEKYAGELVSELRRLGDGVDGLLLCLHGALATPTRLRADIAVLEAVRAAVGPDFPIGLALDLHGNLGREVVDLVQVVCGYHYSPHTDMGRTGERTADLLIRALRGEIRPVAGFARPDIVIPSIFSATVLEPLAGIMRQARAWEAREGDILDVSVFCGFAYADVPDCGMSVIVMADGDAALAQRAADDLSGQCRLLRHQLYKRELVHGVGDGVARAAATAERTDRPVVILEHADRLNDSTYCLHELIRHGIGPAMVPYIWDPTAARACVEAGEGAVLRLAIGGRSSDKAGPPVEVDAKVLWAGHKTYRITGPLRTGMLNDLGSTALVELQGVAARIVVSLISVQYSAIDRDPFDQFGLKPDDFRIVLLRSKTHFREVWETLAAEIVIVDTPDWGPADLTTLPYRHIPDGVFPITRPD
ncbi:MAG: M81 family metallopeptidase [Alphaproteobacteria bacterium]